MPNKISELSKSIPRSATFAVSIYANQLISQGINILDLSVGEPDFETPQFIQDAAKKAINEKKYFGYPPASGYKELKEVIVKKFKKDNKLDYDNNQIVVFPGAKQALSISMMSIIDPGEEVIVFSPYWVSYSAMVLFSRGVPVYLEGKKENDFKVTARQLSDCISSKTRAILFSSPCNPTGMIFSERELREIAEVLERHPEIYVISDEIYEYINFGKIPHFSIGSIESMKDRTITVNGFSKSFAMTGWRLGFSGNPLHVAAASTKLQEQFCSGTCGIVQRAGIAALQGGKDAYQYMIDEYKSRAKIAVDLLTKIKGIDVVCPQGAFYLFPDVSEYIGKKFHKHHIDTSEKLCRYLLEEARVAVVPGEAFGNPNCIRLSVASSLDTIKEAIQRIEKALYELK